MIPSTGLHVEGGKQGQMTNSKKRINAKLKLYSYMIFKQPQILTTLEYLYITEIFQEIVIRFVIPPSKNSSLERK